MVSVATEDNSGTTSIWLEAECGTMGSLWDAIPDINASNGDYVTVKADNNNTSNAPGTTEQITYNFNLEENGNYALWGRTITPTVTDDSFWIKIDNSSWFSWNNIGSSTNWTWNDTGNYYNLISGNHTLYIAYREDGAKLDKILITNTSTSPIELGDDATNCEELHTINFNLTNNQIALHPNPVKDVLIIEGVDLKQSVSIYNISGRIVKTIILDEGSNKININHLKIGIYFILVNNGDKKIAKKIMKF